MQLQIFLVHLLPKLIYKYVKISQNIHTPFEKYDPIHTYFVLFAPELSRLTWQLELQNYSGGDREIYNKVWIATYNEAILYRAERDLYLSRVFIIFTSRANLITDWVLEKCFSDFWTNCFFIIYNNFLQKFRYDIVGITISD